MPLPDYDVTNFAKGLITRIEEESLPKGAASDSMNWLSKGDRIELRRGMALLGSEVAGNGRITGLKVGRRFDGTEIPFATYGRKIRYYDAAAEDWVESGANAIAAEADGEDIAMDTYQNLAGSFVYLSSPNSSIYKIPVANPGDVVDQLSTTHRGHIAIKKGRLFLWNRKDANGGSDTTGLYGSRIDKDELSDYTSVVAEAIGASGSQHYAGTLVFKAGDSKATCMYVSITGTIAGPVTEIFRDDRNGNLTSAQGGTGTINYATGEYDITFSAVTTGAVTADYYTESAGSNGICDFSKSTPRTAGQAFTLRQDDGGSAFQNLASISGKEYCFHTNKTYELSLPADDGNDVSNTIYRDLVGIPYFRAKADLGDGAIYVDANDQNDPAVRLLTFNTIGTQIVPKSLSDQLDLSAYRFEKAALFPWGEYQVLACRHQDSPYNNTFFVRNVKWDLWDRLDYAASVLDGYDGSLIAGDSISNNVYRLFSGLDDAGAAIANHWDSGRTNLGSRGLKKAHRMVLEGLIDREQVIDVYLSFDRGGFVLVKSIEGSAAYVSQGENVTVGSNTVGSKTVGGNASTAILTSHPFHVDFGIHTDRFEYVKVRFVARNVGFAAISRYCFKDIRFKGSKSPVSSTV
jgi:hypothetical protein